MWFRKTKIKSVAMDTRVMPMVKTLKDIGFKELENTDTTIKLRKFNVKSDVVIEHNGNTVTLDFTGPFAIMEIIVDKATAKTIVSADIE